MPYIWVFNMSTVTSPILEVIGKSPIIPRCSTNHWQEGTSFPDESSKPTLEGFPGQMSQGQVLSALWACNQSHRGRGSEALFCRWFGDVLRLSFSCFSLVSCLTLVGPQCKETATFKVCGIFSNEPEEEDSYKDGEPNWRWPGWNTHGKGPNSSRFQWERQQTVLRRTQALESTDLEVMPGFPHLTWTT